MDFNQFCTFNGIESPKQFVMMESFRFPSEEIFIDFTFIMFSVRGSAELEVDGIQKHAGKNFMTVIRSGHRLRWISNSEDFGAKVLVLGGNLDKILSISDVFLTMFVLDESPVLKVSKSYTVSARLFFDTFSKVARFHDNPYQEECLLSLMRAFFYNTGYHLYEALKIDASEKKLQSFTARLKAFDSKSTVRRFIALVEKNARSIRSLSFYAQQLGYHPKYLSSLIKRHTGQSAQSIIDQYAMLLIKAKLSYSKLSIKEISNELDFPSQSDFGKFFKRMTGISPMQFRKQILLDTLW